MKKRIKKYQSNDLLLIHNSKKIKKKKKNIFIFPLKILIFVIIIFALIKHFFKKKDNNNNIIIDEGVENIINSNVANLLNGYNYKKTTKKELNPLLKYVEYSKKGILLNKNNFILSENPKISIVISLYNREQNIQSALRSIQNQNFTDFEIIIIDDFSTDNSSLYVKEYQKEDPRIILLQNKENMGTLYSKSIGVLYAKGQYIQSLDSDDILCNVNYLSLSYKKAIEDNYDFVSSKSLYINELSKIIKFKNPFWVVIWSKLIKKELYQNSILRLGIDILKMHVLTLDDDILAPYMFLFKKTINLPIVGVAHYIHETQHVYLNSFNNIENAKKFCINLMTTVKAFKILRDPYGFQYKKFLLDNFFNKGFCKYFCKKEDIKSLNDN